MNKHLSIVAAVALAIGGTSVVWAQDSTVKDKASDAAQTVREQGAKVGIGSADQASQHKSPNAEAIHDVLAQVAEAALTKDGLDDIAERLVDADRNRLGQNADALKSDDAINGRIEQLATDWKAKYSSEFDIKDEDKVYNAQFVSIIEGEIGDRARTAGEKLEGDVKTDAGAVKVEVENKTGVDTPKANTDGQTAADRNLNDPGRNVATVRIAASHGLPALDVPMIKEAGGWKLDIPDSVDAMKFKSNLQTALTKIGDKKAEWPADADEAYRNVTHCVLMAIYDKSATDAGAAAPQ